MCMHAGWCAPHLRWGRQAAARWTGHRASWPQLATNQSPTACRLACELLLPPACAALHSLCCLWMSERLPPPTLHPLAGPRARSSSPTACAARSSALCSTPACASGWSALKTSTFPSPSASRVSAAQAVHCVACWALGWLAAPASTSPRPSASPGRLCRLQSVLRQLVVPGAEWCASSGIYALQPQCPMGEGACCWPWCGQRATRNHPQQDQCPRPREWAGAEASLRTEAEPRCAHSYLQCLTATPRSPSPPSTPTTPTPSTRST